MENGLMEFEPRNASDKIEFDKIVDWLGKRCVSEYTRQSIAEMNLMTDAKSITERLAEVGEFKHSIEEQDQIYLSLFEDVRQDLAWLDKENYVLEIEAIQRINAVIQAIYTIAEFFVADKKKVYPSLYSIIQPLTFPVKLLGLVNSILDENGEVRPDASSELKKIFRAISEKEREAQRAFDTIIKKYKGSGMLTDMEESYRNGRRVLSVPAEHKRKITGIIHDESTTGKTSYIEPQSVVVINNFLNELEVEKRKEIYKILKQLCAEIRPYRYDIKDFLFALQCFDWIRAKALLAIELDAAMPNIVPHPILDMREARHPLLILKNKTEAKEVVPFDMTLHGPNRILVISGPNAGGKSITLKAVGLIQLMVQFGCLVPLHEESTVGVFDKMFCDIGDQQSIEDDLSTYSSRLVNMKRFLDKSDENTLILIDEFGSGTDPKIGGAIAEAILRSFNFKKVYGVITTHYSNLKMFAYKTKGILNAAMMFDEDQLLPTYKMKIGRPGSSFAYEIAEKSGLSSKIMDYAKKRSGKNAKAVDNLLVSLQREKKELEEKLATLLDKEEELDRLIKTYSGLQKEMDYKRKRLKLDRRELEVQNAGKMQRELEKLIKELESEKRIDKVKEKAKELTKKRIDQGEELVALKEEIFYNKKYSLDDFKEGDFVKFRTSDMTGQIKRIHKGKAEVQVGIMSVTAAINDLVPSKEPLKRKSTKQVKMDIGQNLQTFDTKLDIRGYGRQDAIDAVQVFLETAILTDAKLLKILHGKGNGVLKKAVWNKLAEYPDIEKIWHPEDEFGGEGVTWINL